MAVTRTSAGAMVSGTAGITALFGSGAAAGDFGILICESANQAVSTPSGWTLWVNGTGTGTAGAAGATRLTIFLKFSITAGDISGGIAVADSGDHTCAALLTYSGVDTTRLPSGSDGIQTPASTTLTGSGIAAGNLAANDIALCFAATDRDSATVSTNSGAAWANTTGSNSFPINGSTANGAGGGIIVNELVSTAADTGALSFSCTITSSIWESFILVLKAPAGTVSPSTGHLVFTGYQPTVTRNTNVSPSLGHLIFGGKVPSVSINFAVSPSTGHLVFTGHAPTIVPGVNVNPATGHLVFGGHVPTLTFTTAVSPTTGHLSFGGKIPSVALNVNVFPATGHMVFAGHTPSLTLGINPATGHLVFTGYAPDVSGAVVQTGFPLKVTYRHRGRNC